MPVEIFILSGARQGERLVLNEKEFRAGAAADCQICFDARRDPAAKSRSVLFRLQDDGWYFRATGGEVWIDQTPVRGPTRLSSGNVVRMSESGPDFLFSIVGSVAAHHTPPLGELARPPGSIAPTPPLFNPPDRAPAMPSVPPPELVPRRPPIAEATVMRSPPTMDAQLHIGATPVLAANGERRWAIWALAGLALLVLAIVCLLSGMVALVAVRLSSAPTVVVVPPSASPMSSAPTPPGRSATPTSPAASTPDSLDKPDKPHEKAVAPLAALREAVFVVQVEKGEYAWPLATCVAVAHDTLLTTARAAQQLATYRQQGFKAWITRPAADFKQEVQKMRVNRAYDSLAEKNSTAYVYYDIGLLTVGGGLPQFAPLAPVEDLADVGGGMPVTCLGYMHQVKQVTRFNKSEFQPRPVDGEILVISSFGGLPGQSAPAKLLHVGAEIPKGVCVDGSPVLNRAGRIIGVYSQAAAPPHNVTSVPKDLHYVTMVSPRMIDAWLRNHDAEAWPAAKATATVEKTQSQP